MTSLITDLHSRLPKSVLAVTGGGAGALAQMLAVPGSSRWLLEAIVPYAATSLSEFLNTTPAQACSLETANALAERALDRARWLAPGERALGLGCTASLASDRPKKGEHRIHLAIHTDQGMSRWLLTLVKGMRDRAGEEAVAAGLILHGLAKKAGLETSLHELAGLHAEDKVEEEHAYRIGKMPCEAGAIYLAGDAQLRSLSPEQIASVKKGGILPGAFNPLHRGHWEMAQAAEEVLKQPVAFELSLANVDKPELSLEEARRRLSQFAGRAEVWITRAPRFVDKAALFPGCTFVVGVDTALRLVDPRYYQGQLDEVIRALLFFREQKVRFLVACRVDAQGQCKTLDNVAVPDDFKDLFLALPSDRFRWDVSSTELRSR